MVHACRTQDTQKRIREDAQSSTMKNLVTLLYMISALVVSASSYKCYSCFSTNSTTCKESEVECLGDRCMTCSQYVKRTNMFRSILKSCANETMCGTNGSLAMENVKYRFSAKCCTGHLCNTDRYGLIAEDPTPNGVKCPSAYFIGTFEDYNSTKEMNCTGSMKKCFKFSGEVLHPGEIWKNYSAKGCANDDACKYNFLSAIGVAVRPRIELIC
ncbi:phospholipase A2 inhibitor and Ly6/PLAUR domain-containing protein-like [Anomaloglossus baeobatrachus]|uniref:phospholipase A2 inhibitor and Ly6/PLAUR domain-containing protein-like n=1 Tax=Anomaloglossus baeobatrachus TaxID=238106 RepID=UPI003F5091C5